MAAGDIQCPVPCDYCERSNIGAKWWCETCPMNLCNDCQAEHLKKAIWKSHVTIPLQDKHICLHNLFCNSCDECVCQFCIPMTHKCCHLFYKTEEVRPMKVVELEELKQQLINKIQTSIEAVEEIAEIKVRQHKSEIDKLKTDIETRRKAVVTEIRNISDEMKENVEDFERCHTKMISVFHNELRENQRQLVKCESEIQRFQSEKLDKLLAFLRGNSGNFDFRTKDYSTLSTKELIPRNLSSSQLQRQVGVHLSVEQFGQYKTKRPPHSLLLEDNAREVWLYIGNRNYRNIQVIQLEDFDLSPEIDIPTNFKVGGFAKVHRNCSQVADREKHCILKVRYHPWNVEKIITTGFSHPRGIGINHQKEIVVCSFGIVGKINIYSPTGAHRKQEITNDSHGIIMTFDPQYIVQNHNGDYVFIDKNINQYTVVCLNSVANKKKWVYPEDKKDTKKNERDQAFRPEGLACDKYFNILVSDYSQNEVIILNQDGHFVCTLLTAEHGISRPLGLAIDNAGRLWVGQENGNEGNIGVFKYLLE